MVRASRWYRRPRRDSNTQPTDSKSGALSIELRGRMRHDYTVKTPWAEGTIEHKMNSGKENMRIEQDRLQAIQVARSKVELKPIYLDTETTGLKENDEIVEIAMIDHDGRVLFESLVRPLQRIPADAMSIHGITDDMVRDAPRWAEVWPKAQALMSDREVAIYNADFDLRMMKQSHRIAMLPWRMFRANLFCVMKLYAQFYGDWDSYRGKYRFIGLEQAGRQSKISLPNTHRARDDAALTRALLHYIAAANP
jgi:DNA polymerase-3 subunit epsilon